MSSLTRVKLAAFTSSLHDPSSRLRVRQYISYLSSLGIDTREYYPRTGSAHPSKSGIARIPWLTGQLWQRYRQIRHVEPYDVVLLQRQMIATINTLESWLSGPRILDIDDAVWSTCRFNSIDRLARNCDTVICGNDFIAEHFTPLRRDTHVIPTAVDTNIWMPPPTTHDAHPSIGWIGTHGNFDYLYSVEASLAVVLREQPNVRLLIVSDARPRFSILPEDRVIYRAWSEKSEVSDVQSMTVGIMPLVDSLWARGKCSLKLLQYMACGVPAVASPVGANIQVAAHGGVLLAGSPKQWEEALLYLLADTSARSIIGHAGRQTVVGHYATNTIATTLSDVIYASTRRS